MQKMLHILHGSEILLPVHGHGSLSAPHPAQTEVFQAGIIFK